MPESCAAVQGLAVMMRQPARLSAGQFLTLILCINLRALFLVVLRHGSAAHFVLYPYIAQHIFVEEVLQTLLTTFTAWKNVALVICVWMAEDM